MRNIVIALVMLVAAPAIAQPVAPAAPCDVRIARAPDDVRRVVLAWLADETRCTGSLEVRIVPTDGGLYLFARDQRGRVRERVVPDADSAGVLVASWAAGDTIGDTSSDGAASCDDDFVVVEPDEAECLDAGPPCLAPGPNGPDGGPRGPVPGPRERENAPARRAESTSRWISVGALTTAFAGMNDTHGAGARFDVDVWAHGPWSFGIAGSLAKGQLLWQDAMLGPLGTLGQLDALDAKLVARASGSLDGGGWHLRGSVALGFIGTQLTTTMPVDYGWMATPLETHGVFPLAQASATIGHDLGRSWGFEVGVIASAYSENLTLALPAYSFPGSLFIPIPTQSQIARGNDVVLTAGLRRRL